MTLIRTGLCDSFIESALHAEAEIAEPPRPVQVRSSFR